MAEAQFYNAGSPAAEKRYRYVFGLASYDALNRLKSADFQGWAGGWTITAAHDLTNIGYDVAGNITALHRYRENGTLIDNLTYSYPASSNRLSSVTDAISGNAETWDARSGSFTYDANGNLKSAPAPYSIATTAPIVYDHQNLPLSITRAGTTTTYRYNETGQRIAKQVGTGNTEVYLLDGATSLGVVTVDGAGSPTSWFFNVLAGDKVVGRQLDIGNRRHYHTDHLGSTRSVVEGTAVVESYDFEPWGLLMPGRTLAGLTKEGFTGKEQDPETGLDYFGVRYYMAALGRWTSVDPLANKYAEWSSYNYTLNNPVSSVDPRGLESFRLEGQAAQDFFRQLQADNQMRNRMRLARAAFFGPCDRYPAGACPEWLKAAEDAKRALDEVLIAIGAVITGLLDLVTSGGATNLFEAGTGIGEDGQTLSTGEQLLEGGKAMAGLVPVGPVVGTGLRGASAGFAALFASGAVRGKSIIEIRSALLANGFRQGLTRNRKGFLFVNDAGEQVRIMRRGGGWEIRMQNRWGNQLDEFGNIADNSPAATHGISVFSK